MNTITLRRHGIGQTTVYVDDVPLTNHRASLEVVNHSPDGFEWGYGGSGPSQLALAILLHHTDEAFALDNYRAFLEEHVEQWPRPERADRSDDNVSVDLDRWCGRRGWVRNEEPVR